MNTNKPSNNNRVNMNNYYNNRNVEPNNRGKPNNTSTSSTSNNSSKYSSSNVFGIILLIIIIIVFISACYWAYNYYTSKTFIQTQEVEVMPDIKDAASKLSIGSGSIPNSNFSNEYSISFWVNILDYKYGYGKEKVIMRRGSAGSGNPEILLDSKTNDLIVRVKLQAGSGSASSSSSFQDIPINLNLNSKNSKESFGTAISSNPEEIVDANTNTNAINTLLLNTGDNTVDFPTVNYMFGDNTMITNDYFNMITGNTVAYDNTDSKTSSKENFANASTSPSASLSVNDAVNAIVKVVVDICMIAKSYQDSTVADSKIDNYNSVFQNIIDSLEKSRTTSKTFDDVSGVFVSSLSTMPTQADSLIKQQLDTLNTDVSALAQFNDVNVDFNSVKTAVNAKMKTINCGFTFDGTTESDSSISFYENIINILKSSLYTYINNMSASINKNKASSQSASCIIDTARHSDPTIGTCVSKMIPLQKWTSVIVSIYNQVIDIYIDGQLTSSCILKAYPDISTASVDITPDGGFSGKISRVKFSNMAMTVQNAKQIYYDGPVASDSIFSQIPNWVYWTILIIIVISVVYSFVV